MGERRGSKRLKSFLRGFVEFDKRRGAMSCLVRDLSDVGARIIYSENVTLPDVVTLYVPQKDLTLRARVEWRRGDVIGLAFKAVPNDPPASGELAERIAQLEGEIAALRQTLKRMKRDKPPTSDDEAAA